MRSSALMTSTRAISFGCLVLAVACTASASAQSLGDRLDAVAKQRQSKEARDTTKAGLLGALLYTDITCDFKGTPAKEAITYVGNALGVSLVARYSTDKAGAGIDPETEITLKAEGKPALSVIEMILDQCSADEPCTWQIRDSFIEIGTKARLSVPSAQELRMYPVRDLLFEAPRFDNAPKFNLNQSIRQANQGGQGGGGSGGGGGGFGGGGSGGGGFGGGGSGGGGSGSGGGDIFGEKGDAPEGRPESERAQELVDIITETIEPEMWLGGDGGASIRYYQGVLIVRAPDWVHRQIGGYPFAAAPSRPVVESRYVTFTPSLSIVENVKFRDGHVTGAAGGGRSGGQGGGQGGGGSPINNPSAPSTPSAPPKGGAGSGK